MTLILVHVKFFEQNSGIFSCSPYPVMMGFVDNSRGNIYFTVAIVLNGRAVAFVVHTVGLLCQMFLIIEYNQIVI